VGLISRKPVTPQISNTEYASSSFFLVVHVAYYCKLQEARRKPEDRFCKRDRYIHDKLFPSSAQFSLAFVQFAVPRSFSRVLNPEVAHCVLILSSRKKAQLRFVRHHRYPPAPTGHRVRHPKEKCSMSARPALLLRPLVATVAVIALLTSAGPARADTITMVNIADSELPGLFAGSVTYNWISTTQATITLSLKNVSPISNGGYITAAAFNDPAGAGGVDFSKVTLTSGPANFTLIGSAAPNKANTLSGSPYGDFDLAVSNSTQVLGGGTPTTGIGVNQTGTFVFNITGTGLELFSAQQFLSTYSTDGSSALLVRFRGFNNGQSDKDVVGMPMSPPAAVPAPPGLVLAGIGFGCLLMGRLRTRTRN